MPSNKALQRTALHAAAEPERWADTNRILGGTKCASTTTAVVSAPSRRSQVVMSTATRSSTIGKRVMSFGQLIKVAVLLSVRSLPWCVPMVASTCGISKYRAQAQSRRDDVSRVQRCSPMDESVYMSAGAGPRVARVLGSLGSKRVAQSPLGRTHQLSAIE